MDTKKQSKPPRSIRVELAFLEKVRLRCPNDHNVLRAVGEMYTRIGDHKQGLQIDVQLAQIRPEDSEVWYNLGCSYALVGRRDDSFVALTRAVDLGYEDYDWMIRDADLEELRNDPRFQNLLSRITES